MFYESITWITCHNRLNKVLSSFFIFITICVISGSSSLSCSESAAFFQNTVCNTSEPAFTTQSEVFYSVIVNGTQHRLITGGLRTAMNELHAIKDFQKQAHPGILRIVDRRNIGSFREVIMFENSASKSLYEFFSLNGRFYEENPQELFTFMNGLLKTLAIIDKESWVVRDLSLGNILLSQSGQPVLFDLSTVVNLNQMEVVSEDIGPLSFTETQDMINNTLHSSIPSDHYYLAGLVMYHLMYRISPYLVDEEASLQTFEDIYLNFESNADLRAFDICSQLLYSFNEGFSFYGLLDYVDRCTLQSGFQPMPNLVAYRLADGPRDATKWLKNKSSQFNIMEESRTKYEIQFNKNKQGNRMFNDQNYHTPQSEYQNSGSKAGYTSSYGPGNGYQRLNNMDKQGSFMNQSLVHNKTAFQIEFVILVILAIGAALFNIAAVIFMFMACRKDYFGYLVGRDDSLELSRV